ncbi:MAG: J domain-containing protein, partial [Akkermansia sp.]|nr:J domain-containing protein [Akkermansia sp.]
MRLDYYQLLDVAETATQEEIKLAYRRQAKLYHPDRNPDNPTAQERFLLIAEAYRTLGDAADRYQYDGWLEKQRRYSSAPELASMPHHTRVSVRHAYARREERRRRREERSAHRPRRRVPQSILHRRASKLSPIHYLVFYLICLAIFIPWFFRNFYFRLNF